MHVLPAKMPLEIVYINHAFLIKFNWNFRVILWECFYRKPSSKCFYTNSTHFEFKDSNENNYGKWNCIVDIYTILTLTIAFISEKSVELVSYSSSGHDSCKQCCNTNIWFTALPESQLTALYTTVIVHMHCIFIIARIVSDNRYSYDSYGHNINVDYKSSLNSFHEMHGLGYIALNSISGKF